MDVTIKILSDLKEKHEKLFIEKSIIADRARLDQPVPDTSYDLNMIIELNAAISILQNAGAAKCSDVNCG